MNQMTIQEQIRILLPKLHSYYRIENLQIRHIELYKKCFTNSDWLTLYGFDKSSFNFNNFWEISVLKYYPTVERIVITNHKLKAILFAHLCIENNNCVIVGGLTPELINSGQGITCSLIIFDYVFKVKTVDSLEVSILKQNTTSLRMVKKAGFYECVQHSDKITLRLSRDNYPNPFSQKVLSRIQYDKI
jgi:hypothetical protein